MTPSNGSIIAAARSDPIGAGIVVCVVAFLCLAFVAYAPPIDIEMPAWRWPDVGALVRGPAPVPKPLRAPPASWRVAAAPSDVMTIPGVPVAYWGRPDVHYGQRVTAAAAKPVAIVVHYTDETPILTLVQYQHNGDRGRGGAYGYHFYIDQAGRVIQGAPLSVRTNHVKPMGAQERTGAGAFLDGTNTIGVSLVGACKTPPLSPITYRCKAETPTDAQLVAGDSLVQSLRQRYGMACAEIYGHGDLQRDRHSFEGVTLSRRVRAECGIPA